jgi:hypothetical protein
MLGAPMTERLSSAVDLDAVVAALAELGGANRLVAVVLRPGGTVVARGTAYSELPPSAERLLGTQLGPSQPRAPQVSILGRAETALDGPLRNAMRVRLRVDRKPDEGGSGS